MFITKVERLQNKVKSMVAKIKFLEKKVDETKVEIKARKSGKILAPWYERLVTEIKERLEVIFGTKKTEEKSKPKAKRGRNSKSKSTTTKTTKGKRGRKPKSTTTKTSTKGRGRGRKSKK